MDETSNTRNLSLLNAYIFLRKVLYEKDAQFYKEDWQMLKVAQFLVSKENFLKKDRDNVTLYYGYPQSFYYIYDLSDAIYELASYVYNHSTELVIDKTKNIHYISELPEKYKKLTNPTFDEALVIINMIRNSIIHDGAILDYHNSLLNIDNSIPDVYGDEDYQLRIKTSIPISLISKLDLGSIMKDNKSVLLMCIFDAILKKNYRRLTSEMVEVKINYMQKEIILNLSNEDFFDFYSMYEEKKHVNVSNIDPLLTVKKGDNRKIVSGYGKTPNVRYISNHIDLEETVALKHIKMLVSLMKIFNEDSQKLLSPLYTSKFFYLLESEHLSSEFKLEAMEQFRNMFDRVDFHANVEESLDSISYVLGIEDEEKSVDLVALYSYLILLFSKCPLKDNNVLLTEFLDLSKLSVDYYNIDDNSITEFYSEVEDFIIRMLQKYDMEKKTFEYQMPCINLYTKIMAFMVSRLKIRNNSYLRHIRNALEHSNIFLSGDKVILKDYIVNGNRVDKKFKASISIDNLVYLSSSYSKIYDIKNYKEYRNYILEKEDDSLSFTLRDLVNDLSKEIDSDIINELIDLLKALSIGAFGEELSMDDKIADIMNNLALVAKSYRKGRGK